MTQSPPSPHRTSLVLIGAIPFVVLSSAAMWRFFVNGACPVSKRAFRLAACLQAALGGFLFGLWLHLSPCAFWSQCDHQHESVRLALLFVGSALFFCVSFAACLTGMCVFGFVREKREADEYASHLEETPVDQSS